MSGEDKCLRVTRLTERLVEVRTAPAVNLIEVTRCDRPNPVSRADDKRDDIDNLLGTGGRRPPRRFGSLST